tara:strand:+ start:1573 stop:2202 length:630 start_codon:yes stop_codon:yes gene_type:complete
MKINNNEYSLKDLEQSFAQDFSSPVFPILAEFYFKLSKYEKAKKVCEIGLSYDFDNSLAKYILAKVYLVNNEYIKAEKLLRQVIVNDHTNIKALELYIDIKCLLKKNITTFKNQIQKAYLINSQNLKIKKLYDQLNIKQTKIKKSKKTTSLKKTKPFINQKLATKTMYNVLIKQKKYEEALKLLNMMKKKKNNHSFVNKEYNKIIKKIS